MLGLDDEHLHFLRTAARAPRYSRQLAGYVTELNIFELSMIINSLQFMQIRDFSNLNLNYRNTESPTDMFVPGPGVLYHYVYNFNINISVCGS